MSTAIYPFPLAKVILDDELDVADRPLTAPG